MDASELEALALINAERAKAGATPLLPSSTLARAAAWMSEDVVVNNYFSHTDSLGRQFDKRFRDCGMSGGYWGENIGLSFSPSQIVSGWMGSPGHAANMLDDRFRYAGLGYFDGIWTLDLSSVDAPGNSQLPTIPSVLSPTPTPTATFTPTPTATPTPSPTPVASRPLMQAQAIAALVVGE
jgi:hypothetical protein